MLNTRNILEISNCTCPTPPPSLFLNDGDTRRRTVKEESRFRAKTSPALYSLVITIHLSNGNSISRRWRREDMNVICRTAVAASCKT